MTDIAQRQEVSTAQISINDAQCDVLLSTSRYCLFQTGQGGGKTFLMGVLSHQLITFCPKITGLIAANTYGQLTNSTLKEICNVWSLLGVKEYNKNNTDGDYVIDVEPPQHFTPHGFTFKNNFNKIFFSNGAVVFLASLDNYKVLDGMTLGWAMLDETKDTKKEAVEDVIIGRLRQKNLVKGKPNIAIGKLIALEQNSVGEAINPLFIFTSPAKEQWLTEFFNLENYRSEIKRKIYNAPEYFYFENGDHCIVIASSYLNKDNLPNGYISGRERQLGQDKIGMHIHGDPFGKIGNEYYSDFDRAVHVKDNVEYKAGLPIHITFDFNVRPYMSATVWQIEEINGIYYAYCIKEYAKKPPNDTIEALCRDFKLDFDDCLLDGLFYYGDASGKNRIPTEAARDLYKIVERELSEYITQSSRRLLRKNPTHRQLHYGTLGRRDFMNAILRGIYDVRIIISKNCKQLISDLEFTMQDKNGAKDKKKETVDGVAGVEKYGHFGDGMDYFICWLFGKYNKEK